MLFADDTKLWRLIKSIDDVNILQEDFVNIWLLVGTYYISITII